MYTLSSCHSAECKDWVIQNSILICHSQTRHLRLIRDTRQNFNTPLYLTSITVFFLSNFSFKNLTFMFYEVPFRNFQSHSLSEPLSHPASLQVSSPLGWACLLKITWTVAGGIQGPRFFLFFFFDVFTYVTFLSSLSEEDYTNSWELSLFLSVFFLSFGYILSWQVLDLSEKWNTFQRKPWVWNSL